MENPIIVMTHDQLAELVNDIMSKANTGNDIGKAMPVEPSKRYVYGLRGLSELFNVSHVTAQKYKKTFLAPACMQRGRKIIVDVEMAIKLYNENNGK